MAIFDWLKRLLNPSEDKQESIENSSLGGTNDTDSAENQKEMEWANKVLGQMNKETQKPLLRLTLTKKAASLCGSKVGGIPYIPSKEAVPFDSEGMPLRLLAQIDCRKLAYLPDFPQTGLLQFWIGQDESFGLFTEGGSRVVWHETINEEITEEQVKGWLAELPQPDESDSPVNGKYGISFKQDKEAMNSADVHFSPLFTSKYNALANESIEEIFELSDETCDMIWGSTGGEGHKMGGYPTFTQEDPREIDTQQTVLLLQIDSDYDNEKNVEYVMWGDAGVCGFFCTPDELKRRDFSNVLYTWDCG